MKKIIYWVLSILAIVIIIAILSNIGKNDTNEIVKSTQPLPEAMPLEVTAHKFYNDYNANEVAADEKYKGKKIQLTGTVYSINKDFSDEPYLVIDAGNYNTVNCSMNDKNELIQLKKGQRITILGVGTTMVIGIPGLENCSIINQ